MKYITLILLFCSNFLIAQINIKDVNIKQGITFIDIYNKNDIFISSTNDSNIISEPLKRRILNQSNFAMVRSSFYEPKKISINEMLHTGEILLNPKTFPLNEVIIPKSTASKYLKISGYYRSTELQ